MKNIALGILVFTALSGCALVETIGTNLANTSPSYGAPYITAPQYNVEFGSHGGTHSVDATCIISCD